MPIRGGGVHPIAFGAEAELRFLQLPIAACDPKQDLAHWLMRQDFVRQQSGTVGHSSCSTTGAKAAPFTTERDQFLTVTGFTPDPEKAMLQPAAL